MFGDPTYADAILDRLVHNAYRIELRGGSMRPRREIPIQDKSNANKDLEQVIPDTHTIHRRVITASKKDLAEQ
jgi:hypothetical protein